ncbi:MAG TPA: anthrone oxygenase family protein [Rubrobacter sp.]|nr:anthrone oxygenase family protein [Rubrobacter sp.]
MGSKPNNENPVSPGTIRPTALRSAARALTLACATLTTGLVAGVYYAYTVSVNLGLAAQPDASYVATMQAINERIENPLFFASFFGAALFPLAALAAHYSRRPRSGRFWLIALACVLYIGGSFLLTAFVNVPMNEELARVASDVSTGELSRARAAYEEPWNFWNGVRTVFSFLAFLVLVGACLLREDRGRRLGGRSR